MFFLQNDRPLWTTSGCIDLNFWVSFGVIKSRRMGLAGYVACMGRTRNAY